MAVAIHDASIRNNRVGEPQEPSSVAPEIVGYGIRRLLNLTINGYKRLQLGNFSKQFLIDLSSFCIKIYRSTH
ncbi:hypothetical protein [Phormidesmis sp. 146-33]